MLEKLKQKIEASKSSENFLLKVMLFIKDSSRKVKIIIVNNKNRVIFLKDYFFISLGFNLMRLFPFLFNYQKNDGKIFSNLKREIEIILNKEIHSDYCLLDTPNHNNIGDHFIYQGTLKFLDKKPFRRKYRACYDLFDKNRVGENDLIILHGGGNLGDIWYHHQLFKEKIIEDFKSNNIIIFPQSVYFSDKNNLKKSIEIFSSHKNLTICARDNNDFNFLRENFKNNKIVLVPDMAFCFSFSFSKRKPAMIERALFLCREDRELKEKLDISFIKNLDIGDWPTFKDKNLNSIKNKIKFSSFYIFKGVSFLKKYDLIITNRLHGSVFAASLGIPNILLDNTYGKNKNFYDTWMKNIPNCFFANNVNEIKKNYKAKLSSIIKKLKYV